MKPPVFFTRFCLACALTIVLAISGSASAEESAGERQFLDAREAFRVGDRAKLEQLNAQLIDDALAPYVEYYLLRQGIERQDAATIKAFIRQEEGSYLGERLRADWIKVLGKQGRWSEVSQQYAQLKAPDLESRCLKIQAVTHLGDTAARQQSQADAETLWQTVISVPEGCQPLFARLGEMVSDDVYWSRVHMLFERGKTDLARRVLRFLPREQQPDAKQLDQLISQPRIWLARQKPASMGGSRVRREVVALAITRLAQNDPVVAAEQLEQWRAHLGAQTTAWCWAQIGLQGARRHLPEASAWFARSTPELLTDDAAEWRVRAALRAQKWDLVRLAIEQMPQELQARPAWVYWLGRAHKAAGRTHEARAQFASLRGLPEFYGNLADEELGQRITVPPLALPPHADELFYARTLPGIVRALALFRLDLRIDAIREWNWTLRDMDDRQLLAAATLAREYHLYDRAINAADKTRSQHDYSLRFLAPFEAQVRLAAREQNLDDAWVYGLMRQESRFITQAKSSVGASGLMQLMPATAKWVAKKIGIKDYDHRTVNDTDTNLLLGTAYMRMVLESLHQHPVLASAAYNAGPGRAKRWCANEPLEGAIYAETIPFDETRDYVKKVMSNAVYYSVLFTGEPASLRERLGTAPARDGTSVPADLP
ncbi:MAG: lytic transglycosylase domain-containing protein [Zoogloeaceae bacterium]|jgi:soluble lytic murein transglycosylase|nr:lytic transglycosylase domain-containing protein [Zoogloeaceae bacterium]